jgi:lysophospholipase L1-like esterase
MKINVYPVFSAAVLICLLSSCAVSLVPTASNQPKVAPATAVSSTTVVASDPRFLYEGRLDPSNPEAPGIIWQGSRIRLGFLGDSLTLHFSDVKGQVFFDSMVDGHKTIIELRQSAQPIDVALQGLGSGPHELVLFKRSEAAAGSTRFTGVTLAPGAKAFAAAKPDYRDSFQFVGDSITVGACNEDGAEDQWEDRRTHNNALSYGAMTAAAFSADYRNIAVSGMGVAIGWIAPKAGEIWDRVYPEPTSPRADLSSWKPRVIFVNLGENDDSYSKAKNLPFPSEEYTNGYISLVQAMRAAYPDSQIVILRGGMFGGAQSERLRLPWEAAVKELETADPHVIHFVFKHWSSTHPRVSDHRAMADELIAWLKTQPFMMDPQRS